METNDSSPAESPPPTDDETPTEGAAAAVDTADDADSAPAPSDTLSPAVRRLVRQYDLDITGIHGTGPEGRIRVADVMGMLGGRGETADRDMDSARTESSARGADPAAHDDRAASPSSTLGTIFECDLGRVLTHWQRRTDGEEEPLLTSYFLVALEAALREVPAVAPRGPVCFGVELTLPDGSVHRSLADSAALPTEASTYERLRFFDGFLHTNAGGDLSAATLIVQNYGASGSLLATPLPLAKGHLANVGIGRIRREIAVRGGERDGTPRLVSLCYVSLSFDPARVTLAEANRFLARTIQTLELWPE